MKHNVLYVQCDTQSVWKGETMIGTEWKGTDQEKEEKKCLKHNTKDIIVTIYTLTTQFLNHLAMNLLVLPSDVS